MTSHSGTFNLLSQVLDNKETLHSQSVREKAVAASYVATPIATFPQTLISSQ